MVLSDSDDEAVHFVVNLNQSSARCGTDGRRRVSGTKDAGFERRSHIGRRVLLLLYDGLQSLLKQFANVFIVGIFRKNVVAGEDAAGIGINDEHGMVAGVEKNGIGGLRANSFYAKQFGTKRVRWLGEESIERAVVLFVEIFYE